MYSSCLYRKYRHENDCVKCRFRVVSQFVKKKKTSCWRFGLWLGFKFLDLSPCCVCAREENRYSDESERCGVLPAHAEAVLRTAHAMAVPDCEMGE